MELEHILAEAYEQEHWAKSPDLRHLMTELAGDGFNDAMRAAIDAKRGICEMLSLDEHGRRFFSAPPAAMTEVVANLPESSWIIEAYWSLTNGIYAHVSSRGADQFRHGVAIYDWATASHRSCSRDALAYDVAGTETLMIDVGKRRMRLPKVLLASGIHDSFWEEKKYHDFLPQRDKFASRMDLINLIIDGLRRARRLA